MTTQNLCDYLALLTQTDLDLMYVGATDAQKVELLNWAQRILSRRLWLFDPSLTITLVAGTQAYSLRDTAIVSRAVWRPFRAYINGTPLYDWQGEQPGFWSIDEFESAYPTWRSAANGTPSAAMVADRKIYYYLKPSSSVVSGGSNFIAGCYFAADLSSSSMSAVPDLPVETHEALAFLAAIKGSMPMATEDEAWARLKGMNDSAAELVEEIASTNRKLIGEGFADEGIGR